MLLINKWYKDSERGCYVKEWRVLGSVYITQGGEGRSLWSQNNEAQKLMMRSYPPEGVKKDHSR